MARRIYVGPCIEIVTRLDDVEMVVSRGQSVDVSDEQAEQLDRQSAIWSKPRTPHGGQKEGDS